MSLLELFGLVALLVVVSVYLLRRPPKLVNFVVFYFSMDIRRYTCIHALDGADAGEKFDDLFPNETPALILRCDDLQEAFNTADRLLARVTP